MGTLKKNALSYGLLSRKYLNERRSCEIPVAKKRARMRIRTVLMPCFVAKCSAHIAVIV